MLGKEENNSLLEKIYSLLFVFWGKEGQILFWERLFLFCCVVRGEHVNTYTFVDSEGPTIGSVGSMMGQFKASWADIDTFHVIVFI